MADRRSVRDIVPGFGAALRIARELSGLSQADVAVRAGCGFAAVSKVETEARAPSLRLALALADAVGRTVVELVDAGRSPDPAATLATTPGKKSRESV